MSKVRLNDKAVGCTSSVKHKEWLVCSGDE